MKAPQTEAFRRWFKNSVVRNKNGTPRVVYHGTAKAFRKQVFQPGPYGVFGAGLYFTGDISEASLYSGNDTLGSRVIPVFLSIQNPAPASYANDIAAQLGTEGGVVGEQLTAMGFDGVVSEDHYIVYNPRQVKSALGNRGTFDPKDPNFLHGWRSRR